MRIVDTHCHTTPMWYEPVESLLFQMDRNNVERAVLIQINGHFDNGYQFDAVQRYPDRLASVVLIDTQRSDAADELARCAERGACGVRLTPEARSPGDDPLAVWRKADELGFAVSCAGNPALFASPAFASLVETLPDVPIVIEHLAGMKASDPPATAALHEDIYALARYPNLTMKIHGLGEFLDRNMPVTDPFPFDSSGLPILHRAYETFGPDRLMWGSDFPPVSGREGYANALRFTMEQFAGKPDAEQEAMFGGTARRVFGLG
jgi:L-fuconolactonase